VTARQFYLILSTFVISLKIQKMPCILYGYLKKDSYVLFIVFLVINVLEILLAFYISQKIQKDNSDTKKKKGLYNVFLKICAVLIAFYFLMQGILFYEAIQDLFSHILFENLSWKLFSLFLLGSVFYLACFNFDNIGRVCEVSFFLIIGSLIGLALFGFSNTDISEILPFQTIKNVDFLDSMHKFNLWFGDFFVVLFLGSKTKGVKLKNTLLTYVFSMLLVTLLVIELNGIYLNYTELQPSLISVISENSLLGIDIGRIDWFFILVAEFGTAICSALCLCMAKHSFSYAFNKVKPNIFLFLMIICIYCTDILYLVDLNIKEEFFLNFGADYAIVVKLVLFLLFTIKLIKSRMEENSKIDNLRRDNFDKSLKSSDGNNFSNARIICEKITNGEKLRVKEIGCYHKKIRKSKEGKTLRTGEINLKVGSKLKNLENKSFNENIKNIKSNNNLEGKKVKV